MTYIVDSKGQWNRVRGFWVQLSWAFSFWWLGDGVHWCVWGYETYQRWFTETTGPGK